MISTMGDLISQAQLLRSWVKLYWEKSLENFCLADNKLNIFIKFDFMEHRLMLSLYFFIGMKHVSWEVKRERT